jgi:aconitate hydratase
VAATQPDGKEIEFAVKARIDTPQEAEYYRSGGILPYVFRQILASAAPAS